MFIVVCSKPSDKFCTIIKRVSQGGIGAVESHTITMAQEDKHNLEGMAKVKHILLITLDPLLI